MSRIEVLNILLHKQTIATLTRLPGDRTIFAFDQNYLDDWNRPRLGLSFEDVHGEIKNSFRAYQTRVMPFFANLLPEGRLREYLAASHGVRSERDFELLRCLGLDLPGAVSVEPNDSLHTGSVRGKSPELSHENAQVDALSFSLAGVQIKFSALQNNAGGLTVPASGRGGAWIVKFPSNRFNGVVANEYSMMKLAKRIGIDVPAVELFDQSQLENVPREFETMGESVLAVKRFDRLTDGEAVHVEDFAQVFGVFPEQKYENASLRNIARVLHVEAGEKDLAEFIRRAVFNVLIGNGDMHLKNWALIYRDKVHPELAPAYDFVSTVPYIPNEKFALNISRTKNFSAIDKQELIHFAAKARVPQQLVISVACETIEKFVEAWESEKLNLPLPDFVRTAIDKHLVTLPILKIV